MAEHFLFAHLEQNFRMGAACCAQILWFNRSDVGIQGAAHVI